MNRVYAFAALISVLLVFLFSFGFLSPAAFSVLIGFLFTVLLFVIGKVIWELTIEGERAKHED